MGETLFIESGSYINVNAEALITLLEAKGFTLINVHIPFEGDIPGTDLSIPYNQVKELTDQLPQNKDAKIVLYCKSGPMSEIAANALLELGYTNIWNLDGGFNTWVSEGQSLE